MRDDTTVPNAAESIPSLSKRAARRVIQRAFVLVGRDKALRQKFRSVELASHWRVEDWDLKWTVVVDEGHIEFHRGHVGKAKVSFLWMTGDDFLGQIVTGTNPGGGFDLDCEAALRRVADPLFAAFASTLKVVLADPIDDDGVRLM